MRILFVTPETPAVGGGGIATYIRHAKAAFEGQGHEVYTLSWVFIEDQSKIKIKNSGQKDRIINVSGECVWKEYPSGPFNVAVSYALLPQIIDFIKEISPDLIETTDFKSPMYGYLAERRAGRLGSLGSIPVLGFNHGLTRLLYSKNGVFPQPYVQGEIAAERQAMRWCDAVFVPSRNALQSFEYQVGKLDNTVIVSEPFTWNGDARPNFSGDLSLYHLGRVSFAKGLDHEIHFLNVLSSLRDIKRIDFIGGQDRLAFRHSQVEEYIDQRLVRSLKDRVKIHGAVNPVAFGEIFSPGGFSMNFSNQETFNYAFMEMLSYGLFPFIKAGTPMEEFLPEGIRHICLPRDFDLRELEITLGNVERNKEDLFGEIAQHARVLTNGARYVEFYEKTLRERHWTKKTSALHSNQAVYTGDDITVLMATYNNPEIIKETVASLQSQSVKAGNIVILDDGSSQPEALETLDWLESIPSFKVIRAPSNEGLCACRVKLLEHAHTSLSIFVDSDDLLAPDYFKKTLEALNASPEKPNVVMTWRKNFGASTELLVMDLLGDHYHLLRNDFRMTALIQTEVLKQISFNSSMRNGEADDWLFWLNFNRLGFRAVMVGEALFHYRFAEGSMSWPWSEGQAVLTGIEVANLLSSPGYTLTGQAFEDLLAEKLWYQMKGGDGQIAADAQFAGDTFGALFRWAERTRKNRPRLFMFLQRVSRFMATLIRAGS